MFEGILGLLVCILANSLYIDMKRKGRRGFGRIILFFMGLPLTFLWLALPEGRSSELALARDDRDQILADIRRDRELKTDGEPGLRKADGARELPGSPPEDSTDRRSPE